MPELRCGKDCEDCRGYNEWIELLRTPKTVDWAALKTAMHRRADSEAEELTERGHTEGWLPPDLIFQYGPVAVSGRGQPATVLPFDDPPPVCTCLLCGRGSYLPEDRKTGYCARCRALHGSFTK